MKNKIIYIITSLLMLGAWSSCDNWLDINTDPNTPNNAVIPPDQRLPGMQHYFMYAYGTEGTRVSFIDGTFTRSVSVGNSHHQLAAWDPINASSTTPYQYWFVGSAANIDDMVKKATELEAWHYIGATQIIRALGFMAMVDWFGEIPYKESLSSVLNPKYDDGKTIFEGCLADLDAAIVNLQKTQGPSAPALSKGDGWNSGDVQKWIKLAYGLKARFLNNLSKKSSLYKPDDILAALSKAAQSNAEGTVVKYYNRATDTQKDILVADPINTSIYYDGIGMNTYFFFTKWYGDLLTNSFTGGSNVIDPRIDRLIPAAEYNINGTIQMKRSAFADVITSNIRLKGGPITASYNVTSHKWTVSSTVPERLADSIYVTPRSQGAMYYALPDGDDTYKATDGRVLSTGSFYTRPDAPIHLMAYPELCFIKAEVLFRKGDAAGALTAYQAGIRAHIELMNLKLKEYPQNTSNISKKVIPQADIDAFMTSAAVAQTPAQLTMAKIMQQKYIACSLSQQNWNDMRRFDYSTPGSFGVVYPDFDRPFEFNAVTKIIGTSKTDPRYWFRRFAQCSHEVNYNVENMKASNPEAALTSIWSLPVWWDQP